MPSRAAPWALFRWKLTAARSFNLPWFRRVNPSASSTMTMLLLELFLLQGISPSSLVHPIAIAIIALSQVSLCRHGALVQVSSSFVLHCNASPVQSQRRASDHASELVVTESITLYPSRVSDTSLWSIATRTTLSSGEVVDPQGYEWVASPTQKSQLAIPSGAPYRSLAVSLRCHYLSEPD